MTDDKDRALNVLQRVKHLKYRLVFDSLLVGITVGIVIVIHRILLDKLFAIFKNAYHLAGINKLYIPLIFIVLILFGYIVGKMVKSEPMISGSGIPQVEGILIRRIKIKWLKVLVLKFVGGLMCLGAGLSIGREGPSVQMGACIGEGIAKKRGGLDYEQKYLITSGASAGLAAAFSAPLSGVMFALEEAHKNFSPLVLLSAMISSLSADFVSKKFFGFAPSLHFDRLTAIPLKYYWTFIILGITVGVSGAIFNKGILKAQDLYKKSKLSVEMKVIIPFIMAGAIGILAPTILGGGHELILQLQGGKFTIMFLLSLLVIKFIFTFASFSSGIPGGIFFPLLVLGSLVGNIIGLICIKYFNVPPMYIMNFVVLAMAGHFAATVKAPITGIILITEMTGSLEHLLSLSLVVIIAQLTSDLLNINPIYESLLERLLDKNNIKLRKSHDKKTLLEVAVEMGSELDGKRIKEISWPHSCLIVSIVRSDREIIAKGETEILSGDYITIITDQNKEAEILEKVTIFTQR